MGRNEGDDDRGHESQDGTKRNERRGNERGKRSLVGVSVIGLDCQCFLSVWRFGCEKME